MDGVTGTVVTQDGTVVEPAGDAPPSRIPLESPARAADSVSAVAPPADTAVVVASGRRFSAGTTARATRAIPAHSARARASRWRGFTAWCAREDVGRDPTERGAVPDYMTYLADRAHPHSTMQSVLGTLTGMLAVAGHELDAEDVQVARLVLRDRAVEEATDPDVRPGPVQVLGVE